MKDGPLFRRLRQDRGIKLQEVSDEVNSVSFISKFEKGDSHISLHRMERLLENINVSMEEFLYLRESDGQKALVLDHFLPAAGYISGSVFHTVDAIMTVNDAAGKSLSFAEAIAALEEIKERLTDKIRWQRFMGVYCQLLAGIYDLNQLTEAWANGIDLQEIRERWELQSRPIVSYLYQVENWGLFEVLIFRLFLFTLPNETAQNLLPTALARTEKEIGLAHMKELRFDLLAAIFSLFINQRMAKEAREILQQMQQVAHDSRDLLESNRYVFYQGWYQLIAGDYDKGLEKCHQTLSIFRILDQPYYLKVHQEMLQTILMNRENPRTHVLFG